MEYDLYIMSLIHAILTMEKDQISARRLDMPPKIFIDVCKVAQSTCGFVTGITYEINDRKARLESAEVTESGMRYYNNNKHLLA